MSEVSSYNFNHKEVVEALIKHQQLHEGIWQLTVEFGMAAQNIGANEQELKPVAILAILKLGLLRVEKESSIAADAAKVNPP
jgi:hypothetical protein